MGLLDRARQDAQRITANLNGFAVVMTFIVPGTNGLAVYDETYDESYDGQLTQKTINGLHSKHHMQLDTQGQRENGKNAHVSFSESLMTGYPIRDASGEVNMARHKVRVVDSTGTAITYVINQWYPDETLGLIVCILGDFE